MKKKVLKFTFLLFAVAFAFSSCLGDGENKVEVSEDFVYVYSENGLVNYGFTLNAGGSCSAQEFQQYSAGTCLLMGYKITGNQTNKANLEDVNIRKVFPASDQARLIEATAPTDVDPNEIFPSSLTLSFMYAANYYGDRFLFAPVYYMADGTKVRARFYYDADAQTEGENATPIAKNRAIIDVRFIKEVEASGSSISKTEEFVADFSNLRDILTRNDVVEYSNNAATVSLKFKYRKLRSTSNTTEYDDQTLGTFGSTSDFQLYFSKE